MTATQTDPAAVADVLERAANLIEPEGAYLDAWGSVDADGNSTGWGEKRAVRWSMVEAVYRAARYASEADPAILFVRQFLGNDVAWYNRCRSQQEAVAKLREAAAKARTLLQDTNHGD